MNEPFVTDRIDLLVQAQNRFRWCWDCGMEKEECERVGGDVKCCPDCRHPRVEKNVDDVKLEAVGDYLCEVSNHCTCGAPTWGEQSAHEPCCGLEPVYPLDMVKTALMADGFQQVRETLDQIEELISPASWAEPPTYVTQAELARYEAIQTRIDDLRTHLGNADAEYPDVRRAEMQARANAYYEAALSHQGNPERYKYFFDKRQELLSMLESEQTPGPMDPVTPLEEATYRARVLQYFVDRVKGALDGLGHDLAEFDTKEKP